MKIYLYGQNFELSDANICEARGKFLVRNSIKNVGKMLKHECEKYNSVEEMILEVRPLVSSLMMGLTQHMLYILRREGINTNGKIYVDSVFQHYGSFLVKVTLKIMDSKNLREAAALFAGAAVMDLENFWYGYYKAHGYGNSNEFFTFKKRYEIINSLRNISKTASKETKTEKFFQAFRYIPYAMDLFYHSAILSIGKDENLDAYKNLFTKDFKAGSYGNMKNPELKKQREETIRGAVKIWSENPEYQFDSHIYHYGDDGKSRDKFVGATHSYAKLEADELPLVCFDSTLFGSAEDGLLMTTRGIWVHNYKEETKFYKYTEIQNLELRGLISKDIYIDGYKINTSGVSSKDVKKFYQLMYGIWQSFLEMAEFEKTQPKKESALSKVLNYDTNSGGKRKLTEDKLDEVFFDLRNNKNYQISNLYIYSQDSKVQKKFNNAISSYAQIKPNEKPLVCFDATFFGSAKDGFLLSTKGIWLHNYTEETLFFAYDKISEIQYDDNKIFVDGVKIDTAGTSKEDRAKIFNLIDKMYNCFKVFQ